MRDETIDALWFKTQNEPDRVMAFGRSVASHAEERLHALIRAIKSHDGDNHGREFGLAVVSFDSSRQGEWEWAMQSDIDDAIEASIGKQYVPVAEQAPEREQVGWIDEFGNLFPMAAWKPSKRTYIDEDRLSWEPVYRAAAPKECK